MTFPEKGQTAKAGHQIGIIESVDGDKATLKFTARWAPATFEEFPVSSLTHVCGRAVHRDGGYSLSPCGRPVKEGDLCGLHAGVKKRREAQRAKWRAEEEAAKAERERLRKVQAWMEGCIADRGLESAITRINPKTETVELKLSDLIDLLRNA